MATLDIFNNDAFSLSQLSKAIVDIPRVATRIGDMGLFREYGINTTVMMIERKGASLALVPTAPRGGVAQPLSRTGRKLTPVAAVHLPQRDEILADVVQGIRAFGSETEVESVSRVVTERMNKMKTQIDLTIEYHRARGIMGQVLDADGSSVLWDYYSMFGFTQQVIDFDLTNANTKVKLKIQDLKRKMRTALGGRAFTGIGVLCSDTFFSDLTNHVSIEKAFELFQQNLYARTDQIDSDFTYLQCQFMQYSGGVGTNLFIPDGEAYAFPLGVTGMFETAYAPADYMETVNTNGLPYYAKQAMMKFDKGVDLETQSNPLHLNSLPEAVFKLTNT